MSRIIAFVLLLVLTMGCRGKNESSDGNSAFPEEGTRISSEKIIKQLAKGENVIYRKVTVMGDLDFTSFAKEYAESGISFRTDVSSSVSFFECIFEGNVTCYRKGKEDDRHLVRFLKNCTFTSCEFMGDANFSNTTIDGTCDFSNSNFYKEAVFEGTFFNCPITNFTKTTYKKEVRFQRITVIGEITFLNSVFEDIASFQSAVFKSDAQFGAVKFNGYADFGNVSVQEGFYFNYAEFAKQAIFNNANFHGRTEFMKAKFGFQTEMKNTVFVNKTRFNETSFDGKLDFSNSVFVTGVPDCKNVIFSEKLELILDGTKYIDNIQITKDLFITKEINSEEK